MSAPAAGQPIRVVLVDDHPALLQGTAAMLAASPGMIVVETATSGAAALRLVAALRPDVLILDVRLPDISGVEVARQVRASSPEVAIVVLTGYDDIAYVRAMLGLGVRGYLSKSAGAEEIIAAVRAAAAGRTMLMSMATSEAVHAPGVAFTQRELDVLRLLAEGRRNSEIAAELTVSLRTVEFHVGNVLAKLEARSRTDAVRKAQRQGLLPPPDEG